MSKVMSEAVKVFQFTHPGGVRQQFKVVVCEDGEVSIHAPGRGATKACKRAPANHPRFNSRTREGCDTVHKAVEEELNVSIHAPGRGATMLHNVSGGSWGFQFTHPGGVRR